jgi:hypothetical protein
VKLRRKPKEVLSSEQALARIAEKTNFNVDQLQQNMDQARSESGQFFRVTLIFAGIGAAIIIGGVCLMVAGLATAGLVTTATSLIPQATALLLFNKDKELRKTIEAYHGQILESQKVLTMIDLAETMNNESRDTIKEQIVLAVLKVGPTGQSSRKPSGSAVVRKS